MNVINLANAAASSGITYAAYGAAFITLAEALNKLERSSLRALPLLTPRAKATLILKAAAWSFMAWGSAGVLADAFKIIQEPPSLREMCMFVGFAILIVRTRVKEG